MAFAAGTRIATPQATVAIEILEVGREVVAGAGSAPHLTWTPVAVEFIQGTPPGRLHPAICDVVFDQARSLICTDDQIFMRSDGTLALAEGLHPGDKLLDQDGNDVQIVEVIRADYSGGLYHFTTSLSMEGSVDGHLILAGGVVAGDFAARL
jgi:hypothetical protein